MPIYYLKFDYKNWGNTYHRVVAPNQAAAIRKFIKGTTIPASKVHVWKGRGYPKTIAGSFGRRP
jgi:hypothetical protein